MMETATAISDRIDHFIDQHQRICAEGFPKAIAFDQVGIELAVEDKMMRFLVEGHFDPIDFHVVWQESLVDFLCKILNGFIGTFFDDNIFF